MQIVLTHEQADFDALASLLGAFLLDKNAIPVLPSRMNRNLRAFLTLYGLVLPFVERRDLPAEPVDHVTLVDTQSLVSVKGMHPETQVRVIDHHKLRADLPKDWQTLSEETGANATLFAEVLQERGSILDPIHATLLLLGIYEDTGSLTYSRTTARDLRAAAYLVEQGASFKIANDFLNHPLSLEQEKIYQHLQQTAESLQIHGHTVVLGAANAGDMEAELSTIVHKLRNVLEPDALFVLVKIRGGVQLIARSTDDHIDVAQVAAHFGGGGHPRAAAALIKDAGLDDIRQQLLEILKEEVHPAVTVSELMSRGPQVLTADTLAEEALTRMQRYGYEGYPVVEGGELIGLLTRRAVDRAIAHRLNLPARSLMQAGKVTVLPSDSIEHVQTLMTETGWGQIPVVASDSNQIIGIVTRTDLLKTLSTEFNHLSRQNLAVQLESSLPPARLALLRAVASAAYEQHAALYIVGGFVRDLLLGLPSLDLDLVVEGDAITLANRLQDKYGGRLTSHSRFGTAKWHLHQLKTQLVQKLAPLTLGTLIPDDFPDFIDLISARTEFYTHPTALPTVERGSIKLDLHRRDFTINTLALRLDGNHYGELHDYWGGLNDLNQGIVRVLHSISFVDDPTRMLRAVRYEQRYNFSIGSRTLQLLLEARSLLERVSGERIRHELDHILHEDRRITMLARLQELGLLKEIHPDLIWDAWLETHFERLTDLPDWQLSMLPRGAQLETALAYTLWLIRLPKTSIQAILKKLVFPHNLGEQIIAAARVWQQLPDLEELRPSEISARLDASSALAIFAAYLAADIPADRRLLERYYFEWRELNPVTTGHDLRALGLPPGPAYQQILRELRNRWLDGEITSESEEKQALEGMLQKL
ncbi:MAG: CBS domain-containing protein [Anaerolineales bacterium]|jgi:tRNA nucleotidyltransferase (CCA-adding enzyme)